MAKFGERFKPFDPFPVNDNNSNNQRVIPTEVERQNDEFSIQVL